MTAGRLLLACLVLLSLAPELGEARGKKARRKRQGGAGAGAGAGAAAPLPPPEVLHASPRLEYRSQFMSVAECQGLLTLADTHGSSWNQGAIPQLGVKYFPPDAVADSPLLQAIDARLRLWTGTAYDDLTGFQFRMQRASPAEAFASDPGTPLPISTVHVDNNMKPQRVATGEPPRMLHRLTHVSFPELHLTRPGAGSFRPNQ